VQSVGIGSTTRQLIGGKAAPVNLESINNFRLDSIFGYRAEDLAGFIDETHARWTNIWAAQAKSTIQALDQVAMASAQRSAVTYPNTGTGQRFRDVAALLKAGIGVRAVDLEYQGDWDMHANMGTLENGWLASSLADIAGSISAFREDLGAVWSRVTVVTVTEFGGKIHGKFPGLDDKVLKDGDLVVTADYRSLLTEILTRRAGITVEGASQVFPNFKPEVLSVMKHLSETPLPENFPMNVRNALGNVAYDPSKLPTAAAVVAVAPTPTPSITPAASPSPVAKKARKTITCVKNGRTIRVTGTNPKCPTGYKIKE